MSVYSEEADFQDKEAVVDQMKEILGSHYATIAGEAFALEVGGSGGLLAGIVSNEIARVISTDVVDVQTDYDGEFPHLLREKFRRNGRDFEYSKVEFLRADAQDLPFKDNLFDLVFSLNAFEHIPDPCRALREVVRVVRPGGIIYLIFDPVWTADSGSHFFHRILTPWQHLLSSDAEIAALMIANGASSDEVTSYIHHMNRLPAPHYRDNFHNVVSELGASVIHYNHWSGCIDDSHENHPNLGAAAAKLNLPTEDLLIRGFCYAIQKGRHI